MRDQIRVDVRERDIIIADLTVEVRLLPVVEVGRLEVLLDLGLDLLELFVCHAILIGSDFEVARLLKAVVENEPIVALQDLLDRRLLLADREGDGLLEVSVLLA